jgi:hypothetical protein
MLCEPMPEGRTHQDAVRVAARLRSIDREVGVVLLVSMVMLSN